jgi:SAM-dependent methyltransferase
MAIDPRADLLRVANDRLYPSLRNPNFLVLRSRRLIFQQWIAAFGDRPLTILDVGGRYQPYRPLFGHRARRYIGCDLVTTDLVNVVADGEALPFASEMFDVVVCTQVFDIFAHPHQAAGEMHRVLKPEGALLMSVAACAPRFVDEERWRYLPSGIRSVLSSFSKVTITPESLQHRRFSAHFECRRAQFCTFSAASEVFRTDAMPLFKPGRTGLGEREAHRQRSVHP